MLENSFVDSFIYASPSTSDTGVEVSSVKNVL